jgi:hypothetical protein
VYTEAQKILFEFNQWNLEVSLVRTYPELEMYDPMDRHSVTQNGNSKQRGPGDTSVEMNTRSLIIEHWGEDSFIANAG